MDTKRCTGCKEARPAGEFARDGSRGDGLNARCRFCHAVKAQARRARMDERERAAKNARALELLHRKGRQPVGSDANRDRHYRKKFGISAADVDAMRVAQGNHCKLCTNVLGNGRHQAHLDHDKVTHKIRGLLCCTCNKGLGMMGDNAAGLRRALIYVEGYQPGLSAGLVF